MQASTVEVSDGQDLQALIDRAGGGDVLVLGSGTYSGFVLADRHFTAEQPLVIKAQPGARPVIRGNDYRGWLARLSNVSYVVLDGLTMENGNQAIYATSVDHCIFVNLEIRGTGQEAVHVRGNSRHIDIRNCRIHDTGNAEPKWAEGIYLGMGQRPYENVENVWIEGNEIFATGNAEAVNVKARSYHITICENRVHDIAPGTTTQHNEAAISLEAADLEFRPGVDPDVWIERNEIYAVRYGRWANGIKVSTMGARVVSNVIRDCQQFGIEFNDYEYGPGVFPTVLHGNTITACEAGAINDTILPVRHEDPGPNPNRPQTWYAAGP